VTRDLGPLLAASRPMLSTPRGRGRLIYWPRTGKAKFRIHGAFYSIEKDDVDVPLWRWMRARALAESWALRPRPDGAP
jgi:gentisate 1,2-dioxygenase